VIIYFNQIENSDMFGGFDEKDITDIAYSYENMVEEIKLIVDK